MNHIFSLIFLALLAFAPAISHAASGKILFVPHDDRPISYHQTVDVVEAAGYEMILPPKELLSNAENMGHPEELWQWLDENAPAARSAVIASDSMLYGGLIPSRKHEVSEGTLSKRLANFERLREKNPNLRLYVFDSLMRTPSYAAEGNIEEPEYYNIYGEDFFQYTRLADKQELQPLSRSEKNQLEALRQKIPSEYMEDWMSRRAKNLAATKKLMDYARDGVIDYLVLGRDDNAPLCQTHRENREILAYAEKNDLPKTKFQSMPGIDEFNLLLLNRAIHDLETEIPFVCVRYNMGVGGETVPDFSDEEISASVDAAVAIAGGLKIPNAKRADLVLLVNTDEEGKTFEIHNVYPDGKDFLPLLKPGKGTRHFAKMVEEAIGQGEPVAVADITFANGSDNALMKLLQEKHLLFRLMAYSGWNTATNSTGFALGTGMLASKMTEEARQRILAARYLDDWAYQANVRAIVGNEFVKRFGNPQYYMQLGDKQDFAEKRNTELMREFAEKNLPQFPILQNFTVTNPWKRMFECDIRFDGV